MVIHGQVTEEFTMTKTVKCKDGATVNISKTYSGQYANDRGGWLGPVRESTHETESDALKAASAEHGGIKSTSGKP